MSKSKKGTPPPAKKSADNDLPRARFYAPCESMSNHYWLRDALYARRPGITTGHCPKMSGQGVEIQASFLFRGQFTFWRDSGSRDRGSRPDPKCPKCSKWAFVNKPRVFKLRHRKGVFCPAGEKPFG
jgi:hypothetical protein